MPALFLPLVHASPNPNPNTCEITLPRSVAFDSRGDRKTASRSYTHSTNGEFHANLERRRRFGKAQQQKCPELKKPFMHQPDRSSQEAFQQQLKLAERTRASYKDTRSYKTLIVDNPESRDSACRESRSAAEVWRERGASVGGSGGLFAGKVQYR